ncbi:hypothetical protein [Sunxiuqinia indica]|uniref:hypothetical protein n=1 Tax=Sunxiuqinia indica TaxID=2692584 RepID=UPI0013584612|nr:hypothetical protein [Sunxiuqinia indica]
MEEKKILEYLLDNEKISRKQAVSLLELGETKVKEIFGSLLSRQLIQRNGRGRSTFYTLTPNPLDK